MEKNKFWRLEAFYKYRIFCNEGLTQSHLGTLTISYCVVFVSRWTLKGNLEIRYMISMGSRYCRYLCSSFLEFLFSKKGRYFTLFNINCISFPIECDKSRCHSSLSLSNNGKKKSIFIRSNVSYYRYRLKLQHQNIFKNLWTKKWNYPQPIKTTLFLFFIHKFHFNNPFL